MAVETIKTGVPDENYPLLLFTPYAKFLYFCAVLLMMEPLMAYDDEEIE